ncbi:MAG TPA: hypothetical protein VHM72_11000 [Solirubrobacteraceae bacterium]|nr:hypothetical protein [Solirubrobacteraceae bacterium]
MNLVQVVHTRIYKEPGLLSLWTNIRSRLGELALLAAVIVDSRPRRGEAVRERLKNLAQGLHQT